MPRPQRTKAIAPRAAATLPLSLFSARAAEKPPSSQLSSSNTTPSDDSDGLVTSDKTGINRRGIPKRKARMSGALAIEYGAEIKLQPPSGKERAEISRIARDADHAMAVGARRRGKEIVVAVKKLAKREELLPSSLPEADTDILDLDTTLDSIVVAGERSPKRRQSNSILRGRTTPTAESSLMLGNFKRRKRQPSILGLRAARNELSDDRIQDDDADDFRPDDESTPFNLSTRKQPTITSLSRDLSFPPEQHDYSSVSRKRKLTPPVGQVLQLQPSPEQSLSSPTRSVLSVDLNAKSPRVNRIATQEKGITQQGILRGESEEGENPNKDSQKEASLEQRSSGENLNPRLPPPVPSPRMQTPECNETMAPPESSSSSLASEDRSLIRPYRTKNVLITSKPGGKHSSRGPEPLSVGRPSRTGNIKEPLALKPITTASLQNLLPRRQRKRRGDAFDIASSSEAEFDTSALAHDEDELSFVAPLVRKKKVNGANVKSGKVNARISNGKGRVRGKTRFTQHDPDKENVRPLLQFDRSLDSENEYDGSVIEVLKPGQAPKFKPSQQLNSKLNKTLLKPTIKKTYQVKNNNGNGADSRRTGAAEKGKASWGGLQSTYGKKGAVILVREAKKFAEIDRWEMEFEEDSRSGSSPVDAR